jgi:hypothetical protein
VVIALSLGLTAKPPRAQYQAAEVMARIVAERLVEHLAQSGFVVMRRPVSDGGAGGNPGARGLAARLARRPRTSFVSIDSARIPIQ